jgi:acyl carrier protein
MIDKIKLIDIFSKALNIPEDRIKEDVNNENLEEWDSLGHLAILTAIDNETKGKASKIETLSECTSFSNLFETLKKNKLAK